jgi:hemerythrin-like metal-binding protein
MNTPTAIEWNAALETGVAEIDSQHRFLVDVFNRACTWLHQEGATQRFDEITRDLLGYAIFHFEAEEGLMLQSGYDADDTARHLQTHRDFSARLVEARAGLRGDDTAARIALLQFLGDWLAGHIRGTDRQLAAHVLRVRQPRP